MIKIMGKNSVIAAANSKRKFFELFLLHQLLNSCSSVMKYAESEKVPIKILTRKEMTDKFGDNHQGIVAHVEEYTYVDIDKILLDNDFPFLVLLDGLEDPQNLGAILRTAEATNVDCVIIPKNRSVQLNDTVAKVSVGALERVKVAQVTNITQTIKKIKEHGIWVVGTCPEAKVNYKEIDGNMRIAVVIGNEGRGISRLVKDNCDFLVKIPMGGYINSLNASVCAALLMYEVFNDRNS